MEIMCGKNKFKILFWQLANSCLMFTKFVARKMGMIASLEAVDCWLTAR
jgi:hypothetical protein